VAREDDADGVAARESEQGAFGNGGGGKRDAQGENGTIASRDDGFKREIGRFEDDVGTGERGERGGDVVDGGVADETAARVGRRRWGDERGVASSEGDDEGEVREGAERDAREREGELRDVKI
jgi:hypothetical protein